MRTRISYANVAATLALLFSMSGGALAATHYLINSTKQINPKVLKTLRGKEGPRGASGPAGASGATGATGPTGATGATGAKGETGAPGSALAYAHVTASGILDEGDSKGMTSADVNKIAPGEYCFEGLGFTPVNAVASIDQLTAKPGKIEVIRTALGPSAFALCGSESAQAGVFVGEVEPGVGTKGIERGFYVSFN